MKSKELLSVWTYRLLWWFVLPFVLIRNLLRSRRLIGYRQQWWQRVGWAPKFPVFSGASQRPVWIHAVSVGETAVAIPLIRALKQKDPDLPILVTTMTPTGAARIYSELNSLGHGVEHCYAPYDLGLAVEVFLKRVSPRALIMIETEIWPNWVLACQRRRMPVALVNGRLSESSALAYAKFGAFSHLVVSRIDAILMQWPVDASRMQRLGAIPAQLTVTGSIKQDIEFDQSAADLGADYRQRFGVDRPVWVAASTHEGEEALLLEAHRMLLATVPNALWLLVPRHPDRFEVVAELLSQQEWCWQKHSAAEPIKAETQVVLGDVLGEMLALFAASDVAVMAGSFAPIGGHNMLEAMVMGVPVLIGPQVFNFETLTEQLVSEGALLQVKDATGLVSPLVEWLEEPSKAQAYIEAGQSFLERNRGALVRAVAALEKQGII